MRKILMIVIALFLLASVNFNHSYAQKENKKQIKQEKRFTKIKNEKKPLAKESDGEEKNPHKQKIKNFEEDKKTDPWLGEMLPPITQGPQAATTQGTMVTASQTSTSTTQSATTAPEPPLNVIAQNEGMQIATVSWDAPVTAVDGYVFGVGTTPGAADIRWWQVSSKQKAYFYPSEYNLPVGTTIYFSVKSYTGSTYSAVVASNPVYLSNQSLGQDSNTMTVAYADYGYDTDGQTIIGGWTPEQIARFNHFTSRMLPIIREFYGAPAYNMTVTFVRDLYYSSSNIYLPTYNEIHMDDAWYPQLLTHELIHAFRDNVIISSDNHWRYDDTLSAFEEGFAQQVSYACINRYIELYPGDPYVTNATAQWSSSLLWDYDFQNEEELRTTDFWSDSNGMGLPWRRYEMAAAGINKIQMERTDFYAAFNQEWYAQLNADPSLRPSKELTINIIQQLVPQVEGIDTPEWFNQQYVFDCRIHPGKKIWARTQHYPYWQWYRIYHYLHYYETFSNGSDWTYWDGTQWVYHHLNGSSGLGELYDFSGNLVWQGNLLMTPIQNPPDYYGFGWDEQNLVNQNNDMIAYPPDKYVGGLHPLSLYRMDITFDQTQKSIYRVMGDDLVYSYGIWGGIIGARGGVVYVDHEGYPPQPPLPVINGVFHGPRNWAGIFNPASGYWDTVPGKVFIRYVDENNNEFTKQENIGWGSWNGNQIFLLDVRQPPILQLIGNKTVMEDQPLTFMLSATDPDGDPLTFSATGLPPGAQFDAVSATFTWIPNLTQAGDYVNVHFEVTDGTFQDSEDITITVLNANQPPVLEPIFDKTFNEGTMVSFSMIASDPENDLLTFSASGLPAGLSINPASGAVTGTLNYTSAGSYPITCSVSDGSLSDTKGFLITVTNVNQPPVLQAIGNKTVDEVQPLTFTVFATDSEGDPLTFSATGLPSGAQFDAASAVFTWTPSLSQAGVYPNVHFEVSDGVFKDSEDIVITVLNVNQSPVMDSILNKTFSEGASVVFNLAASDPDSDPLTFSAVGLPAGLSINPASGAVTGTLNYTSAGSYPISCSVSDGSLSDTKEFLITVTNVNLSPVANAGPDKTAAVKTVVSFDASGSTDPDGSLISYSWNYGDGTSSVGLKPTHTYNTVGIYTVTLTVTDNEGAISTDTCLITIKKKLRVSVIAMSLVKSGNKSSAKADVTVLDESSNIISAAQVSGHWGGLTSDLDNVITSTQGVASISSNSVLKSVHGTFTFTVDNVTKNDYIYDQASNAETSDSINQ